MRAFCVRRLTTMSSASFAAASTSRVWCSTEGKEEKTERAEETVVTPEALEVLKKQLDESKEALAEMQTQLAYRAADAENARRIGREDVDKAKQYGITSFGKDMLEVADTLSKGIEAFEKVPAEEMQADKALNSIYTGVKLSLKVLHQNMSTHGIEKMGVTVGTPFDFNLHDALARMPVTKDAPNDTVCHVLKDGYTIKDRVLRAAQVGVAFDP